jgi:septal ring factor EnvC (AmiA/AmiB activator)
MPPKKPSKQKKATKAARDAKLEKEKEAKEKKEKEAEEQKAKKAAEEQKAKKAAEKEQKKAADKQATEKKKQEAAEKKQQEAAVETKGMKTGKHIAVTGSPMYGFSSSSSEEDEVKAIMQDAAVGASVEVDAHQSNVTATVTLNTDEKKTIDQSKLSCEDEAGSTVHVQFSH